METTPHRPCASLVFGSACLSLLYLLLLAEQNDHGYMNLSEVLLCGTTSPVQHSTLQPVAYRQARMPSVFVVPVPRLPSREVEGGGETSTNRCGEVSPGAEALRA